MKYLKYGSNKIEVIILKKEIVDSRIKLAITNFNKMSEVKGNWSSGLFRHSAALIYTMKNLEVKSNIINKCRQIVLDNTSVFSNFRGTNLLNIATQLSLYEKPEEAFKEILSIYSDLKDKGFRSSYFLTLAAFIIFSNLYKTDAYEAIEKTKQSYDIMKSNHWLLTSYDDYCTAALIGVNSSDVIKDMDTIETCYNLLNKKAFYKNNNLQALSNILMFSTDPVEERCEKVLDLYNSLLVEDAKINNHGLPILGLLSMVTDDYSTLAKEIKYTTSTLSKEHGFGFFLGANARNIISGALVAACYCDEAKNYTLGVTTNNTILNIVMAMESAIAATTAATAAAAIASNGN
jgi:hypothetical protein